jgi:hypothetical protein
MGRAKNTIKQSDVSSAPIKVKYSVTYPSQSLGDYGITTNVAVNYPYDVNMTSTSLQSMAKYRLIRQLYYQQAITGSIGSSSFFLPAWQATAASGTFDDTDLTFPVTSGDSIGIIAIPSIQFGEQVSRNSFMIKSNGVGTPYTIVDDGNGNLIDTANQNTHVGNLFYAQGIAVVTNADYIEIFTPVVEIYYLTSELDEPLETESGDPIILE